ncbi:hypothetical protein P5673_021883 [Acropora cervicornis]|uniref:Uncharacterized protein n=1 Tax=Acropora cervicornis TaxID=6130 RepID=A0AAD9V034_ACRCE|nr:hypothetical protein P5673_021883 [Acropora cervicornis]
MWKYFHEMESCIGGNPNVRPKFTLESRSSSTAEVLGDDNSEEGGEDEDQPFAAESSSTTKGKASESGCKQRKRKRKSKSSAVEMLTFLSSYEEQHEENERQRKTEKKLFLPVTANYEYTGPECEQCMQPTQASRPLVPVHFDRSTHSVHTMGGKDRPIFDANSDDHRRAFKFFLANFRDYCIIKDYINPTKELDSDDYWIAAKRP